MDMSGALTIHDKFSWNAMTLNYSECVIYTKVDFEQRTDKFGVSTLLYLQTLFLTEWNNFLERLSQYMMKKKFGSKIILRKRVVG